MLGANLALMSERSAKKSPDPIKREFLRLANRMTEAEMDDAALEEASEKLTKRPRRAEQEDE